MALTSLRLLLLLLAISQLCHSYFNLGRPADVIHFVPQIPTPRPHQLPRDEDIRIEVLPSMITGIAPSITIADNGTFETMYSMHYHDLFEKRYVGKGIFKRGVFANDPPVSTCTPCGGVSTSVATISNSASSSASCTLHSYGGVFRSVVGAAGLSTSTYCYDSNYSGVFVSSTVTTTGLPCCFTIPASCLANYTSSNMLYTYTTGVFRSSSSTMFLSNFTTSSMSSFSSMTSSGTASPSSSSSLTMPSSTSSSKSTATSTTALNSGVSGSSGLNTRTGSAVVVTVTLSSPSSSSSTLYTSTSSRFSSSPESFSASSSTSSSSAGFASVLDPSDTLSFLITSTVDSSSLSTSSEFDSTEVLSSTLPFSAGSFITGITTTTSIIVVTRPTTGIPSHTVIGVVGPRPGEGSPITLSVITVMAKSSSFSPSPIVITVPNTIKGCGTASGSGVIVGTGTVYVGPGTFLPVVSSGTVSGYAALVVGCGTITATSGSFSGSATIVGCGSGSGFATIVGSGTVWPAALGGIVPIVSSGTVTGSGRVQGCGTIIGSGTFSATQGLVITSYPSAPPQRSTVEVYVSYCPAMGMGMPRLGENFTDTSSQSGNSSLSATNTTLLMTDDALDNPLCQICPNDEGICCPLSSTCNQGDGHCPWQALEGAGYVLAGLNVVAARNISS